MDPDPILRVFYFPGRFNAARARPRHPPPRQARRAGPRPAPVRSTR